MWLFHWKLRLREFGIKKEGVSPSVRGGGEMGKRINMYGSF